MEERHIRTGIDRFLDLVNSSKELRISEASKNLGVPESTLELWAEILHQENLLVIGYDGLGKMLVRPSLVEKPAAETPIKELAPGMMPKPAEHKMSLRERLSGMNRTKSHKLLKKYSTVRSDADAPTERGIVSKLLTLFKGSLKMPAANKSKSERATGIQASIQSGPKTAGFPEKVRLDNNGDINNLRKKIAMLKNKVGAKGV